MDDADSKLADGAKSFRYRIWWPAERPPVTPKAFTQKDLKAHCFTPIACRCDKTINLTLVACCNDVICFN
jgi:hypothetical protein